MPDTPPLHDDLDVHHLINLLAMLPGPDDVPFWNTVDRNGRGSDQEETQLIGDGYLIGKMEVGIRGLLNPQHSDIAYFCEYLLKFFDGERPLLWQHLSHRVAGSGFTDQAGERWTRDLCDTAWRLTVRYSPQGQRTLAENWPNAAKPR